jgi:DNA-binding NarL/FixJ family response regulator
MRSAFAAILAYGRGLEVVGEAHDGREAVLKCEQLRPDLVLMDLSMPEMDGIEATRAIKERLPTTVVLVVTAHEDEDLMLRAIRAGAAGYVLKGDDPWRLIAAVRQALSGDSPMDQRLAGRLLRRLAAEESPADCLAPASCQADQGDVEVDQEVVHPDRGDGVAQPLEVHPLVPEGEPHLFAGKILARY